MSIDLSTYDSVQANLFVKLDIPDYDVLYFSDYHKNFTIGSDTYNGLGELLAVGDNTTDLRALPKEITIAISGVPESNITDILNNKIKGSAVTVKRAFFNAVTGEFLNITGNPVGKFQGYVNNFDITDDLPMGASTGTISVVFTVTSVIELLNNKIAGRRTNPIDFPNEESMDRVVKISRSNFNFGAPQ